MPTNAAEGVRPSRLLEKLVEAIVGIQILIDECHDLLTGANSVIHAAHDLPNRGQGDSLTSFGIPIDSSPYCAKTRTSI